MRSALIFSGSSERTRPLPDTGGSPVGGTCPLDVVADVVVFLASDAARHVTGSVIFVDGAQSLLQG